MDASALKQMQAPFKQRYREQPEAAMITLKAEGAIGEGLSCKVATGKALVEAGLHPATGGSGLQACSGDMLLEALVACAGVTLNAVATALEIPRARGPRVRRGRSRLPRHARGGQGRAGRLQGHPAALRARQRRIGGPARHAAEAHRALLRGVSDAAQPAGRRGPNDPHVTTRGRIIDCVEAVMALELRPNCECCDIDLPPQSAAARICSYECTFCAECVERLQNVCPNCGGGFVPRPIRPTTEWRPGISLEKRPPSNGAFTCRTVSTTSRGIPRGSRTSRPTSAEQRISEEAVRF